MPEILRCPWGHEWSPDRATGGTVTTIPACPVCGAAPTAPAPVADVTLLGTSGTHPDGLPSMPADTGTLVQGLPPSAEPSTVDETLAPSGFSALPAPSRVEGPASARTYLGQSGAPDLQAETMVPVSASGGTAGWEGTLSLDGGPAAAMPRRTQIPGYEIESVLGRGGMGVVYKARQIGLNRTVALKMILSGSHAGPEELGRFKTEAEAVARLTHPNIVQIYEIGEHNGLPFFSLEFLEAGSLQQYLDGTPLPDRLAASLVEKLASAMQHAHEHGIVHRDLKPANVLLGLDPASPSSGGRQPPESSSAQGADASRSPDPRPPLDQLIPKITDFGLAKRLEVDQGQTATEAVLGTPTYMAPEQAAGRTRQVGPTADVYSLGAILYDLLTGRPPFKGTSTLDTLKMVTSVEPIPPARLVPQVPRDLDTVVLKCLQKNPEKRYTSAADLAADLRRFLDNRPVLARPIGSIERTVKWVKRHPSTAALIGVSAVALVVLVVGSIAFGIYNSRKMHVEERLKDDAFVAKNTAIEQKGRAEEALKQELGSINEFFTAVAQNRLLHQPQMAGLRRELLEKALVHYEELLRRQGDAPGLLAEAAAAQRRVGDLRGQLGDTDAALTAYRGAVARFDRLSAADPASAAAATDERAILNVNLALALLERHPDGTADAEAEDLYRAALSTGKKPLVRADACLNLGDLLLRQDHLPEAETAYRAALDALGPPTANGDSVAIWSRLAKAQGRLAILFAATGKPNEADREFQQATDELRPRVAERPRASELSEELGTLIINRGTLLRGLRRYREAANLASAAADFFQKQAAAQPSLPDYRLLWAMALRDQALAQQPPSPATSGRALKFLEQADKIFAELDHQFGGQPLHLNARSKNDVSRAHVLEMFGRTNEAETAYQDATERLDRLIHLFPKERDFRREAAYALNEFGGFALRQKAFAKGAERIQQATVLQAALVKKAPNNPTYALDAGRYAGNLGEVKSKLKEYLAAEQQYHRALAILAPLAKARPYDAEVLRQQLDCLIDLQLLLDYLKRPAAERAETRWQVLQAQYNLGRCLLRAGRPAEGRHELDEALTALKAEPNGSPLVAQKRFAQLRADLQRELKGP